MILSTLSDLRHYAALNPLFGDVVKFLYSHDLDNMPTGKTQIVGDDLFLNIVDAKPRTRREAKLETHRQYIDIQIPLDGVEEHGWTPLAKLPEAPYDADNDIAFYDNEPGIFYTLRPHQCAIYFPEDGHAPAICNQTTRKAIFKVKVAE